LKPDVSQSPMLAKRLNGERSQFGGIDLGMNVKNVRPVQARASSKSFHHLPSSLKRQKTEVLPYKAVSNEFNI
jgi:hypothetical protein